MTSTCRICKFHSDAPCVWNGDDHGQHTLCSRCARLEALLVQALRIEHKARRAPVALNSILNRADELTAEDLDDQLAEAAVRDLVIAHVFTPLYASLYAFTPVEQQRFWPGLGARARRALAVLPRLARPLGSSSSRSQAPPPSSSRGSRPAKANPRRARKEAA